MRKNAQEMTLAELASECHRLDREGLYQFSPGTLQALDAMVRQGRGNERLDRFMTAEEFAFCEQIAAEKVMRKHL